MEEKLQELRDIIKTVLRKELDIQLDTPLKDVDLDSLDFMEIMFEYEERYDIETGKWNENITTIGQLLEKLFKK